jgi:hypothetical protein
MVEQQDPLERQAAPAAGENDPDVHAAKRFTRLPTAMPLAAAVAVVGVASESPVGPEGGDGD